MRTKEQLQQKLRNSLQGGNPLWWEDPAHETSSPVYLDDGERAKIESDDFDDDTILSVRPLGAGEGSEIEVLPSELFKASIQHVALGVPVCDFNGNADLLTEIDDFIKSGDMQSAFNLCYNHCCEYNNRNADVLDWLPIDCFFEDLNADETLIMEFKWHHSQVWAPDCNED